MPTLDDTPIGFDGGPDPIAHRAANRRFLAALGLVCIGWCVIFPPHWSGSIEIFSVRIAWTLQSDTVRLAVFSRHRPIERVMPATPDHVSRSV